MRAMIAGAGLALTMAGGATAQDVREPFTGASAGIEAGLLSHRFKLDFSRFDETGETLRRFQRTDSATGFGGGLFAGYDHAVSDHWRIGGELGLAIGGGTPSFAINGFTYERRPRYGLRGVLRGGYVLTPRLMGYGTLGYGYNRFSVRDRLDTGDTRNSNSGVAFGGGAEYRVTRRFGTRLDAKRVGGDSWQLFVGLPVRF